MLRTYFHISFFFFIIVAMTGILMRAVPFFSGIPLPYDHILHAHSHIAMLGFQFLAVFVIFLTIGWKSLTIKIRKQAAVLCLTLTIISVLMFVAFLYQGYGVFSIIMSALHIFAEYWAIAFIYKQIRKNSAWPKSSRLFIGGSLIALLISSIGPYALGYTSANGLKDTFLFDSAVYFYLHFQYNGWLTLVTFGLFIMILSQRDLLINQTLVIKGFWIYFIALFPSYLSSILWIDGLGSFVEVFSSLGVITQWIAVMMIIFSLRNAWRENKGIALTLLLFFMKSSMELGLTIPGLAELVYETRSIIIGYLHLTLLGFISIFILVLYFMTGYLRKNSRMKSGFIVFLIGFIMNEFILFWQGLSVWTGFGRISFALEGLLVASILLGVGILLIWFSSRQVGKEE